MVDHGLDGDIRVVLLTLADQAEDLVALPSDILIHHLQSTFAVVTVSVAINRIEVFSKEVELELSAAHVGLLAVVQDRV